MEQQPQNPPTQALATTEPTNLAVAGELSVKEIAARVHKVHEIQREVMKEGKHYGKIPGVDKPTLLKPGAAILGMVFRLDPQFEVVEQLREGSHVTYVMRCVLYHAPTGTRLGSGMGSCSTRESKYAYRKGERVCPDCGKPAIIKGAEQYGGGWLCWKKKDGCGKKFGEDAPAITSQVVGRIENEDVADQHNTVLKMAIKRAHVAAILFVTCASEIFTQDMEDMPRKPEADTSQAGGGTDEVSTLLADYAKCKDGGSYQRLEKRRGAIWSSKKITAEQKRRLKAAQEAAQERVLAGMDAPTPSTPEKPSGRDFDGNVGHDDSGDDAVDGEFEDDETPHGSKAVA